MSEANSDNGAPERRAAERTRVLLAGVVGAAVAALAASRDWTTTTDTGHAGITATTAQAGTDLASWALPCALAGGAAFLAMLATGNRARRVLGVVAALAGLATVLAGVLHLDAGPWPIAMGAAALVLAFAGAAVTARAGGWPDSASRYDAGDRHGAAPDGNGAIAEDPVSLWNALDSGEDPSSPNITASAQQKGRS
ncbi:Trp biosynthesis-associated membrane protein [Glycomyces sp. NPDC048151]|uniref:Trp biosynthesis-associated membrane protein n=1 Tax=Glycomyces sp. NPDC048151 TaxID=3364002 RepID=UPI00370FB87B